VRWVALTLGAITLAMVAVLAFSGGSDTKKTDPMVGRIAPPVEGTTIDGQTISMSDYRGRWVVLNFFASWCTPCLVENPELAAFHRSVTGKGDAVLLAVTFDNAAAEAREFFERNEGGWPVVDDPENKIGVTYGIAQIPETFVISPNGTIVRRFSGTVTKADLDETIAAFETPR
jgi:cytochrome c biogenesis protein CcmG/thiol:disulfide interchange protein DsbE